MSQEHLAAAATKAGFSPQDVADILSKWGPVVLKLVIDCVNNGFSLAFVKEVIETVGPMFLVAALRAKKHKLKLTAAGQNEQPLEGPVQDVLVAMLLKMLPVLLEKYGPQLMQLLLDYLVKALQTPDTRDKFTAALYGALAE